MRFIFGRRQPVVSRRARAVDSLLIACGIAAAASSATFAAYMIAIDPGETYVAGGEHFGLFGRPRTALLAAKSSPSSSATAMKSAAAPASGIDVTPVGSIPALQTPFHADEAALWSGRVAVMANGSTWIETRSGGYLEVRIGDVVARFGRISAIERIGNRWVVRSESGNVLENNVAAAAQDFERVQSKALSRNMIFDSRNRF